MSTNYRVNATFQPGAGRETVTVTHNSGMSFEDMEAHIKTFFPHAVLHFSFPFDKEGKHINKWG
jgi:hypothetical protein